MLVFRAVCLLALAALLLGPAPATANDPLRLEVKVMAERLRDRLAKRNIRAVKLGAVASANEQGGSSGSGLRQLLSLFDALHG